MRTRSLTTLGVPLGTLLGSLLLTGCSGALDVTVHNATPSPITATLRVDRIGSRGITLANDTIRPGGQATLSTGAAPQLEYVELAIGRPGDLGDLPITKRLPRGKSAWTIATDPESWTGFSIVKGIDNPEPSSVSTPSTSSTTAAPVHD
ncbi:MAG: hypothetical protein ACI89L_000589 [Phycisphaerales bacterium]|jgi:hypothetical protein